MTLLRFLRRRSRRALLPVACLALVATLSPLAAGQATASAAAVQPMPPSADYFRGCAPDAPGGMPKVAGACWITPRREHRPTIVIWGDSHALQWVPALKQAAEGRRLNLVGFFMGFCPPFLPTISAQEYERAVECQQSNYLAKRFVDRLDREQRPVRVLLGGAWQMYAALRAGTDYYHYGGSEERYNYPRKWAEIFHTQGPKLFRYLGSRGIRTDAIGQAPVVPDPEYLACGGTAESATAGPPYFGCPYERGRSLPDEGVTASWLRSQLAALPRGRKLVDVADTVCWDLVCPGLRDGVYTFYDVRHVTATRSRLSYRAFLPTVRAAS